MSLSARPRVTVVIPTYNRRARVSEALDSVRQQTLDEIEVIVVDDGSQDGSADWIKVHYPEFQVIALESNVGAAAARNVAIEAALGDYIAFLDDDDVWPPNYLEVQVNALQAHPECVLSFTNYSLKTENGAISYPDLRPTRNYSSVQEHLLTEFFIHSMSIVMVRAQALKQTPLNPEHRIAHDFELYLRLLAFGNILYLPDCFVARRATEGSLASQIERIEDEERMFLGEAISRFLPSHIHNRVRAYRALLFAKLGWDLRNDLWFSLKRVCRAFLHSPFWTVQILSKKLSLRIHKKERPEVSTGTFVVADSSAATTSSRAR